MWDSYFLPDDGDEGLGDNGFEQEAELGDGDGFRELGLDELNTELEEQDDDDLDEAA